MAKKINKVWIIFFIAVIVLIVINIIIAPGSEDNQTFKLISDGMAVVTSLVPIIFGLIAAKKIKIDLEKKSIYAILVGFSLWAIAEIIWLIEDLMSKSFPLVSPADILWLLGYPILFIGLALGLKSDIEIISEKILFLSLFGFILFSAIMSISIIFPLFNEEISFLEKLIGIAYPLGDTILIFGALVMMGLLSTKKGNVVWRYICGGMILTALADFLYTYLTWNDLYYAPALISQVLSAFWNLTYNIGYLLPAIGFYFYVKNLKAKNGEEESKEKNTKNFEKPIKQASSDKNK